MIPDEVYQRLYAAPVDEFVTVRKELSDGLRAEGDKAGAAAVAKLKKPTVPAWAVNQLARRRPEDLSRLFGLRDEMADADGAAALRSLASERKSLLVSLVGTAQEILTEAGHPATGTTVDRITQTLQAGDTPEDVEAITRGTLTRELAPSGFGGLGPFGLSSAAEGDPSEEGADEEAEAREEARERAEELAKTATRLEAAAREAEEEWKRAVAEAERAEKRAKGAADSAEKARAAADEAAEVL